MAKSAETDGRKADTSVKKGDGEEEEKEDGEATKEKDNVEESKGEGDAPESPADGKFRARLFHLEHFSYVFFLVQLKNGNEVIWNPKATVTGKASLRTKLLLRRPAVLTRKWLETTGSKKIAPTETMVKKRKKEATLRQKGKTKKRTALPNPESSTVLLPSSCEIWLPPLPNLKSKRYDSSCLFVQSLS